MSIFQRKPTQFELFPKAQDAPAHPGHRTFFGGKLILSIESISILIMAVVVIMVMSFSLGMEKGKRISKTAILRMLHPELPRPESLRPPSSAPEAEEVKLLTNNKLEEKSPATVPLARLDEGAAVPGPVDSAEAGEEKVVDKFYTIQVASFKKRTMAQKEAMQLQDKGYDIIVVPKGQYSIVCVGKFPVEEEARVVSQELKKKYKDCLIRRL
ncbi:MAG: SPOR domain-containing protein [Candidatus Omnitrophota bacterium]|jgi:cell division septation protein DedD